MKHKEEIKLALLGMILNLQVSVLLKQLPMVTLLTLTGVDGVYLTVDLWLLTGHGIKEMASEILVSQLYGVSVLTSQFTFLLCRA